MNRLFPNAIQWLLGSRRKLATAAIGALLCLLGYHAVFGPNGFLAFHQKQIESERLSQEIKALQIENERREEQIKALKSDPHAIEKEAREHLHYAREGETVYKLPTPTPADQK